MSLTVDQLLLQLHTARKQGGHKLVVIGTAESTSVPVDEVVVMGTVVLLRVPYLPGGTIAKG